MALYNNMESITYHKYDYNTDSDVDLESQKYVKKSPETIVNIYDDDYYQHKYNVSKIDKAIHFIKTSVSSIFGY